MDSIIFDIYDIAITAAAVAAAIIVIAWTARRTLLVARKASEEIPEIPDEKLPPLSIVVYTANDSENLTNFIPAVMAQDYPSFDVVVVDASVNEYTKDVLLRFSLDYPNLYHTFIPRGTENLSRKKLAIMLGLKAANHDYVLLTTSSAIPASDKWLRGMAAGFAQGKDVVIGYSHIDYAADTYPGKRMRAFDTVMDSVQYLSYALRGRTYRADGNSLAYRKQLFFDNKGFHSNLNLHFGDDDLFIREITTPDNTAVCISRDAQPVVHDDDIKLLHHSMKMRYGFTFRYIHTWAKYSSGAVSLLCWLLPTLAACAFPIGGIEATVGAGVPLLATWGAQMVLWRKACKALGARPITITAPFLALARPFYNLRYKFIIKKNKKSNFTWQRRKNK